MAGSLPQETDRHVILWVDLLDLNDPNPPISHPQNLEETTQLEKNEEKKILQATVTKFVQKSHEPPNKCLHFPEKNLGRPTWHPPETFSEADLGWAKTSGDFPKELHRKHPPEKPKISQTAKGKLHLQKGPLKKRILLGTRRVIARISSSSST